MNKKEFFKYLDSNRTERLRIRLEIEKGKLVNLLFQYESLIKGKWREIVRYDFAHGFFHRDVLYPDGTQEKTRIDINDLNLGSLYAEQDLKDRWEFYKGRYIKRMKKNEK